MRKSVIYVWTAMALSIVVGCKESDVPLVNMIEHEYAFVNGMEGWQGGFSDLPTEDQDSYELNYGHRPLPEETGIQANGLYVQGHNRSDDLFMFFKREINGLKPNTSYRVVFDIELASKYPEESFGIGGSPGASVYLKVGAVNYEPAPVVEDKFLTMNIGKGNQSVDGENMFNVGTIAIPGEDFLYKLINRNNKERPLELISSNEGTVWVIIGTDSGFEGLTELYYNRILVTLEGLR